ncbi:MAG TPA: class I SAM-dependent methyltransferase [Roseiflexaceae bacterium]|jgi:SAM-dependent methyltransferase|nr:class I SAM-dependent methyltransferase [Roseiflexaceae bacterium]
MTSTVTASDNYILGHDEQALERLIRQSDYWAEDTRAFLQRAGLQPGMRVLDLGSGAGDVALLAAALVGPRGSVVSVDRAPEAVERATQRAAQLNVANVQFVQADINAFEPEGMFDAVIGRLVLLYLPDPAAVLRRLAASVTPNGIIAMQDFDMQAALSEPPCPTFERGMDWIRGSFTHAQIPIRVGLYLHAIYLAAGLPAPQMVLNGRVEGAADSPGPAYLAATVRNLLPLIEKSGLATRNEIDIDTLADRIRAEMLRQHSVIMPPSLIGAWVQLP